MVMARDVIEWVLSIRFLATLNLGASVEQPFDYLVIQNRQAMHSTGRSMDWKFEDNIVNELFLCATLTSPRRDAGVKSDPRCSCQGHSGKVGADVGDESTESYSALQPLRIPFHHWRLLFIKRNLIRPATAKRLCSPSCRELMGVRISL